MMKNSQHRYPMSRVEAGRYRHEETGVEIVKQAGVADSWYVQVPATDGSTRTMHYCTFKRECVQAAYGTIRAILGGAKLAPNGKWV